MAFDLAEFDLGFAWAPSTRAWAGRPVLPTVRDAALAGPDGIGTSSRWSATGVLSPAARGRGRDLRGRLQARARRVPVRRDLARSTAAATTASSRRASCSASCSRASPRLYVSRTARRHEDLDAGDDAELPAVRYARQNGVASSSVIPAPARPVPGALVNSWGPGNWSGSADEKLRTLRAGPACRSAPAGRFLVYGYFSSATPSAMARVFQAYGCRYAMLLDMNALEHTYMALYRTQGARRVAQHLIEGMGCVDGSPGRPAVPRFLGFADDRDFFYLLRARGPR